MARMRTLKAGFFTNEELAACSPLARLLFAGLWVIADRDGRLEDRPRRIRAELLPYDEVDVDELLDELDGAGFIRRYEIAGSGRFIWIVKFRKHQRPSAREVPSVIPVHPDHVLGNAEAEPRETQAIMPFSLGDQGSPALSDKNAGIRDPDPGSGIQIGDPVAGADPEPAPAHAVDPAALAELTATWERATGHACTPMTRDMLHEEIERGTPPAWIVEAIRDASGSGAVKWRYVASILERYWRERPVGGTATDEIRWHYYQQDVERRAQALDGVPWHDALAAAEAEVGPYAAWLERWEARAS